MAADDRTSQDAAVIGDDLVEALGFEPINSDLSEVAVLDDFDGDDLVDTVVDDIEILEDRPAAGASIAADTVEDEPVEEDELLHGVDSEEAVVHEPEAAAGSETTEPLVDEDELDAGEPPGDESVDESAAVESAASDVDVDVDGDVEPVVFFNNGIDTDTAPLADVDLGGGTLADGVTADSPEVADLAGDAGEDDAAASDDDSIVDELIDLDGEGSEIETTIDHVPDIDLSESESAALDDRADLDGADLDGADLDGADLDPAVEGSEAVSLLGAPILVPGPPAVEDRVETPSILVDEPSVEPGGSERAGIVAPQLESEIVPDPRLPKTRKKLRARKSRRVIRHIDPWSVLTFSVLFHLCFFAALLLASVLVWNAALAAGTIENIESFIRELGDYETFEINSDQVFRAAALIAGLLTLASSVLVVLLTVVFNLISDLIGGIRVTVIEEETVRIPTTAKK